MYIPYELAEYICEYFKNTIYYLMTNLLLIIDDYIIVLRNNLMLQIFDSTNNNFQSIYTKTEEPLLFK